jgi:monoterpene epsilon-lactone hydrolase
MPNWRAKIAAQVPLLKKPRSLNDKTPIAELRRHYDAIAAGFGSAPPDITIERAQLGQVKGEWVRPAEAEPHRLILYLHGGGFLSGSPEAYRPLIGRLCKTAAAAALSIDYRLAPEFPFPAGLRDVVDAYRFLITKGISPQSIVLAGDGAGGGLAFAAIMAIRNSGIPMPAACVAMSPWADLTLSGWSVMRNAAKDGVLNRDLLFLCARHYLKEANPGDPYASPALGNLRDFPPLMVHAGSLEILRDDAARLGELAAQASVPVSVEVYDGQCHLFQATSSSSDAKVSLGRLGQFIRARTPDSNDAIDLRATAKGVKHRGSAT